MPFTPLHAGPGLLLKGLCGKRLSLLSFLASQVVIDLEPLYYMMRHQWLVHRMTHTLLGAAVVAGLVVSMMALIRQMPRLQSMTTDDGECSLWGISVGALVGTWSHVLLDSIVHLDVRLFAPFNDALPFYGLLEWEQVNLLCIVSAAVGLLLHVLQRVTARPAPTH